jgi:hypothetical protein
MTKVDQLLALPGASLADATELTGASPERRERITGYQGLRDLDVIEAPSGERIHIRGDDVVLVYVGPSAVPVGLTSESLSEAVGSDGELLSSRQGKRASLHVVADRGVAWSEEDGEIGFIELFPPTTLATYRRRIFQEPPTFAQ